MNRDPSERVAVRDHATSSTPANAVGEARGGLADLARDGGGVLLAVPVGDGGLVLVPVGERGVVLGEQQGQALVEEPADVAHVAGVLERGPGRGVRPPGGVGTGEHLGPGPGDGR